RYCVPHVSLPHLASRLPPPPPIPLLCPYTTLFRSDHPPALGIDGFRHLNSVSPVPTVAIGGVREEDISPLRAAGAAGICFVSALCAAPDAEATARRFVAQWHGAS